MVLDDCFIYNIIVHYQHNEMSSIKIIRASQASHIYL